MRAAARAGSEPSVKASPGSVPNVGRKGLANGAGGIGVHIPAFRIRAAALSIARRG